MTDFIVNMHGDDGFPVMDRMSDKGCIGIIRCARVLRSQIYTNRMKLILIDDETATRNGIMQYVHWKELGIDQIRAFSSAITALDEGVCWKPDIILSDIHMPGMDGIELCRKFHEVLPDSDIIFVTAYASIEYMREAFRMRAVEFLKIFLKILWSHNRILRIMLYIMLMSASV